MKEIFKIFFFITALVLLNYLVGNYFIFGLVAGSILTIIYLSIDGKYRHKIVKEYLESTNSFVVSIDTLEEFYDKNELFIKSKFEQIYKTNLEDLTEEWINRYTSDINQNQENIITKKLFLELLFQSRKKIFLSTKDTEGSISQSAP